ncbi:MAG: FAD-dependent thymidylate synthase [Nanoarchaeota archaeon]
MQRRVYTLTGLPPEVVAVAFAKCSRSPEPFDKIASELNEDKSRQFHEKWVVGYGHSSVAEHAVLSLAIENVSILATKVIEDNRLASYTEKSTRYQVFDKEHYYKPKRLMESKFKHIYEETSDFIMDTYIGLFPKMVEFFKNKFPNAKEIEIKNMACDTLRYLLPVSALTNLGMTVNARNLEWGIAKLMTHPLEELNEIGDEIKKAALKNVPTLIKYTEPNKYLGETIDGMGRLSRRILENIQPENKNGVILVEYDADAENKIITSLLYRFSHLSYNQVKGKVKTLTQEEKENIIDESLKRLDRFDRPLRELEAVYYTFDVLMDYGAFRDVQRHRMCTQTNQDFTVEHGYNLPDEIKEAGFEGQYSECMERAKGAFNEIALEMPYEAQYIIPLAYNKRVLMTMNLRTLFHFIKLRSGKMGHISYRRVAQQMYDIIKEKQPSLAKYIECDKS